MARARWQADARTTVFEAKVMQPDGLGHDCELADRLSARSIGASSTLLKYT